MAVESTDVARERPDPVDMLLATRPRILVLPRLRPSDASFCVGFAAAVLVLARRLEIALIISSCGLDRGWSDGAGAVDTVLVGELMLLSDRGAVLKDRS